MRKCVSHHFACYCRERYLKGLEIEVKDLRRLVTEEKQDDKTSKFRKDKLEAIQAQYVDNK